MTKPYISEARNPVYMKARKGITFKMVGGVILALVGVAVLLGVVSQSTEGGLKSAFCSSYRGITAAIPGAGPSPAGCREKQTDYKAIDTRDKREFTLNLASAIMECWQEYKGLQTEEQLCEGWNIKNLEGSVDKSYLVDQVMRENDLVPGQIGGDQIRFRGAASDGGGIEKGELIRIQYVAPSGGNERIEVR